MALVCGVCVANAGEMQEIWCGDKTLNDCINHFEKQCESKNYAACWVVGDLHYGQEQYNKTKKYYEMVCDKADSKSTFQVKLMDGKIAEFSAIDAIKKATCGELARFYYDGLGVRQDYSKALQYRKKACNLGDAFACAGAGSAYFFGEGTKKDYKLAKSYFEKSCEMESGIGCGMLGAMYHNGDGVKKNLSKAKELYGKACDLGEQAGCDKYKMLNMWK